MPNRESLVATSLVATGRETFYIRSVQMSRKSQLVPLFLVICGGFCRSVLRLGSLVRHGPQCNLGNRPLGRILKPSFSRKTGNESTARSRNLSWSFG